MSHQRRPQRERREPSFSEARPRRDDDGDLRAPSEDRAPRGRKAPRPARSRRRPGIFGRLIYWGFVLCIWGAMGLAALVAYHAAQLPPIDKLAVPKRPPNVAILAHDGALIANRGETGGRNLRFSEVPDFLPKAFIAIEDRRFYSHYGIDPVGIGRALVRNLTSRGVQQGGSTLTQQLAKNLFLTQERTASRKIQEAILALWLEHRFSKDEILELYMNRVYFGSGAYGVEAAAQRYFGKSARAVSLAEAAMLAGLVQAPSRLAPNRNPEAAERRAQMVLAAMAEQKLITEKSATFALAEPAEALERSGPATINYVADMIMDLIDDFVGPIEADVNVLTTIDPKLQSLGEAALVEALDAQGARQGVSQGALVSLAPDGAIRALIGGRHYAKSQFNRATSAKRQPGSAFKPFVYLTALEKGLTPDTIREDSPVTIKGWSPENASREFRGPVTLQTALAMSLNTVAVKLGQEVGERNVVRTAQRLGISSALKPIASLPLGTSEVTPLELAGAYAAFANGGNGVLPYAIREIRTTDGKVLHKREAAGLGPVIPAQPLAMMNGMMRETLATGTGRKADLPGWQAAGKTGTTQEFRDAWFAGYTAKFVTVVWLGNDDGTPMKRVSGSGLPAEIWARYMKAAHVGQQPQPLPGGLWRSQPAAGETPMVQTPPPARNGRASNTVQETADRPWTPPSASEKGFLERLFGG